MYDENQFLHDFALYLGFLCARISGWIKENNSVQNDSQQIKLQESVLQKVKDSVA